MPIHHDSVNGILEDMDMVPFRTTAFLRGILQADPQRGIQIVPQRPTSPRMKGRSGWSGGFHVGTPKLTLR